MKSGYINLQTALRAFRAAEVSLVPPPCSERVNHRYSIIIYHAAIGIIRRIAVCRTSCFGFPAIVGAEIR